MHSVSVLVIILILLLTVSVTVPKGSSLGVFNLYASVRGSHSFGVNGCITVLAEVLEVVFTVNEGFVSTDATFVMISDLDIL